MDEVNADLLRSLIPFRQNLPYPEKANLSAKKKGAFRKYVNSTPLNAKFEAPTPYSQYFRQYTSYLCL